MAASSSSLVLLLQLLQHSLHFLCPVIFFVCALFPLSSAIVTLRPKNERVAWDSGVECLERIQLIFHSLRIVLEDTEEPDNVPLGNRTKNVIMFHVHNLSSPAAEIEWKYRIRLNQLISEGELRG